MSGKAPTDQIDRTGPQELAQEVGGQERVGRVDQAGPEKRYHAQRPRAAERKDQPEQRGGHHVEKDGEREAEDHAPSSSDVTTPASHADANRLPPSRDMCSTSTNMSSLRRCNSSGRN